MDYGELTYRRLYSRGGLSDQLSSAIGLRGSRLGNLGSESETMARLYSDPAFRQRIANMVPMTFAVLPEEDPTSSTPPAPTAVPIDCDCAVANIGADEATAAGLLTLCRTNPTAFADHMRANNLDPECREWYMEPRNWAIGAGVVAVGALLWWAL